MGVRELVGNESNGLRMRMDGNDVDKVARIVTMVATRVGVVTIRVLSSSGCKRCWCANNDILRRSVYYLYSNSPRRY